MSLLKNIPAPRLMDTEDRSVLRWAKNLSDLIDNRSGQLIFPFSTMALVNGANQDVKLPAAAYIEIEGPTIIFSIGGLAGGSPGRVVILANNTLAGMTINNADPGSQATNQINTITGGNIACTVALLVHRSPSFRWFLVAAR